MNIFVGNLSFETTEAELKQLFETIGEVSSVVIVMEKEKKAPKSRGFGFVEMPVEAQALAAISALNGKDFMGRLLNVNPTRPKTETQRKSELEKRALLKFKKASMREQASRYQNETKESREAPAMPFIPRPGTYKGGRRTRSYMIRTGKVDMDKGTKSWQERQENPMRWRNSQDQQRPWLKSTGGAKPWQRSSSGRKPWEKPAGAPQEARPWERSSTEAQPWKKPMSSKPWQKSASARKPWEKSEGSAEAKPWKKPISSSKPWQKSASARKPWERSESAPIGAKPWKRASADAKPWKKPEGTPAEARPWKKPAGNSKPWVKRSERPQGSRFKARVKSAKIMVDKRE